MAQKAIRHEDKPGQYHWTWEDAPVVEVVKEKDLKTEEKKEISNAIKDFKKSKKSKKKK